MLATGDIRNCPIGMFLFGACKTFKQCNSFLKIEKYQLQIDFQLLSNRFETIWNKRPTTWKVRVHSWQTLKDLCERGRYSLRRAPLTPASIPSTALDSPVLAFETFVWHRARDPSRSPPLASGGPQLPQHLTESGSTHWDKRASQAKHGAHSSDPSAPGTQAGGPELGASPSYM